MNTLKPYLKYIIWAAVAVAVFLIVRAIVRAAQSRASGTAAAGGTSGLFGPSDSRSEAAQQAADIRQALFQGLAVNRFHPWGEDTEALYRIAARIRNFGDVAREYSRLYDGDSIITDLQLKLDGDEYAKFTGIARGSGAVGI